MYDPINSNRWTHIRTFLVEASKALHKLTEARDRLDVLNEYHDGSSLFNKQQLND